MSTMISIGRNDPCPCESGKKYKRCCRGKVEAAAQTISRIIQVPEDYYFPQLHLAVDALALAAGLAPVDDDAGLPDPELLGTYANKMLAAVTDLDEDESETIFDQLMDLLENHFFGRHIRFDADELYPALEEFVEDEEKIDEISDEQMAKRLAAALDILVTEDLRAKVIWQLIGFLQQPDLEEDDYPPLIWALFLALDDDYKTDNPIWTGMFQLSCSDLSIGHEELAELVDKYNLDHPDCTKEEWVAGCEAIDEYIDGNPLLAQDLSQQTLESIQPGLMAITEGKILSFPPYSVINGIRDFYRALLTWIVKTPKQSGNFLRDYVEYLVEHDISEEDFLIFGTTVTDIITQWVHQHKDDDPELCESLLDLAQSVAMGFLDSERRARVVLYMYTIDLVDSKQGIKLISTGGLEEYACALETEGNQNAADHVRAARQRLEDNPVVANLT